MTPADLDAWRLAMGVSAREACRQLAISEERWGRMRLGRAPIPAHIGLACAALWAGLEPWSPAKLDPGTLD